MEQKLEALKLLRKDALKVSDFKQIEEEARNTIDKAKPEDLLVLTITNNSPELTIKKAEPFTPEVFDKILKS